MESWMGLRILRVIAGVQRKQGPGWSLNSMLRSQCSTENTATVLQLEEEHKDMLVVLA